MSYLSDLGLDENATPKEVQRKYWNLCQTAHPDAGGSQEDFIKLNKTYQAALKLANTPKTCEACKGKGKITQTNGFDSINMICRNCSGKGSI